MEYNIPLLQKLIIGNNYGFIRGKRLATLNELNGKANTNHTHTISDVTNLQSTLNQYVTESEIDGIIESYVPTISKLGNIVNGSYTFTRNNKEFTIEVPQAKVIMFSDKNINRSNVVVWIDGLDIDYEIDYTPSMYLYIGDNQIRVDYRENLSGSESYTFNYLYCYFE